MALLVLVGFTILSAPSVALPIWTSYHTPEHPASSRHSHYHPKRVSGDLDEKLEPWAPNGVPGHIDLMVTGPSNQTVASHIYNPYTAIQSIPSNPTPYKIAEIGYTRSILASNKDDSRLLNARPFGWGTKFWMLKSHDVDCYAGSPFAESYNTSNQTGGTEYPVTLRSPLEGGEHDMIAYCATYDPNPRGSGMTLGAAPCGTISCAPLPQTQDPVFPNTPRNPDGTFAPKFFTTRPCNYLDPNCHVSQIFLYNPATGAVRPMYHTRGMDGVNRTWISSGQLNSNLRRDGPEPLLKRVQMVFRQGDMRVLPGWPEPDPALVVADPAFDVRNVSRSFTSNAPVVGHGPVMPTGYATAGPMTVAGAGSPTSTGTSSSTFSSLAVALAPQSTSAVIAYPVWFARPAATLGLNEP
ncbi:hypothetical protein FRC10_001490 [Ceratobasidium sp. 414]|nr:hypothetical protein FRC10_001490 [Ceratobasidium sp. 414]